MIVNILNDLSKSLIYLQQIIRGLMDTFLVIYIIAYIYAVSEMPNKAAAIGLDFNLGMIYVHFGGYACCHKHKIMGTHASCMVLDNFKKSS